MRNQIIPIFLLILVSLSVFVISSSMERYDDDVYFVEVDLSTGWNLVAGTLLHIGIIEDSDIQLRDIKAAWLFTTRFGELSPNGEYVRAYPDPDMDRIQQRDDSEMTRNAMWLYSSRVGKMKYLTINEYPQLNQRKLYGGWNFVTITPDMFNGNYIQVAAYDDEYFSWDSIVGTCNIETTSGGVDRIYVWNYISQDWITIDFDEKIYGGDFDEFLGHGMIVKTSDNCNLGEPGDGSLQPPQIPN